MNNLVWLIGLKKVCSLQNNPLHANHETEAFLCTWLIHYLSSAVSGRVSHSTSVPSPYLPFCWTTSRQALIRAPALSQSAQHTWQDQPYHLHQRRYVNPVRGQRTHPDGLGNAAPSCCVCCQPSWFYEILKEPSLAYHIVTINHSHTDTVVFHRHTVEMSAPIKV